MLYILGGLPATGKTELSKYLSSSLGAVHIRIDTIEQELKNCGFNKIYDEGYKVAFALALENLKNGLSVEVRGSEVRGSDLDFRHLKSSMCTIGC